MKVTAILQARASSSRLPNKVILPVLDRPMLARQLERILQAKKIEQLIVATSTECSDNPIAELCESMNISCYRGDLNDVLARFYYASAMHESEHIVRLTGDCPLTDPSMIDSVIKFHIEGGYDYSSNSLHPTLPDGLDVEIIKASTLREIHQKAVLPSEREHVTLYINNNKSKFKIGSYESSINLSEHRWTVDEQKDLDFVREIYSALYENNPNFTSDDILLHLESNPELLDINSNIVRNEGLIKSQQNDNKLID